MVRPGGVPGTPLHASEPELAPITEVVTVTPAVTDAGPRGKGAGDGGPGTGRQPTRGDPTPVVTQGAAAAGVTATPASKVAASAPGAAPRGPHGRPMVLVPAPKRRKEHRDRIFTIRVALFVLVFVGVLEVQPAWWSGSTRRRLSLGSITAMDTFRVAPAACCGSSPPSWKGRISPRPRLLASNVVYLRQGMEESSYQAARNIVHNLGARAPRDDPERVDHDHHDPQQDGDGPEEMRAG